MHKSTLPLFPSLDECPQLVFPLRRNAMQVSHGESKCQAFKRLFFCLHIAPSLHVIFLSFPPFKISHGTIMYYILIPVNKSKAVRLGTRLFSNDALPQWSLLYKCCLPVVGLLKSRPWKTLKRGCTTVLWQDMQSNAVREHPVRLCCEHRQCQGHKNSSNEAAWHDKPYKLWHLPCGR